jgi:hypothetical protein
LPELSHVRHLGKPLTNALNARYQEAPERKDLDWWRRYFQSIRDFPWLMGEVDARDGGNRFCANFVWLVGPKNMEKVLNGFYQSRQSTGSAGEHGVTVSEKKAIIAKYTDKEGQRDDKAILRELRAIERERGIGGSP